MRSLKRQFCRRIVFLKYTAAILLCLFTYYAIISYNQEKIVDAVMKNKSQGFMGKQNVLQKIMKNKSQGFTRKQNVLQKIMKNKSQGFMRKQNVLQNGQKVKKFCAAPIRGFVLNMASGNMACRLPKLDPFHPQAMTRMKHLKNRLRCKIKRRATLSGGVLKITGQDVAKCSYRYITRPKYNDFSFTMSKPIAITSRQFPIAHEYIELTLHLTNKQVRKEYLMQVIARPKIISRPSPPSEIELNILIIGIDSISNAHAQRKLPKSYSYIRDVLQGFIFMGHSVVGDGTTEQLAAFLTGQGEQEWGESRRGEDNAEPVDKWNWIFKKAKAKGFVTSYFEDMPEFGTFQYRLLGFKNSPTDYYSRPFFLAADKSYSRGNPYCYGGEKIYDYSLTLARKIYEQYPGRRKFVFHFLSSVSHNKFNEPELMDEDLLQFLTEFNMKGHLNNTLLVLMGDHGLRIGEFRQTIQGKLEERLPLFTMIFPKWFKEKYKMLAKNLKTNTGRLTSWFDVYATYNHLLEYPNQPKNLKHGMSLLNEVPADRSCKDASIPQHWCPCMQWSEVDKKHEHIKYAALAAVDHINDMVFHEQLGAERCAELSLLKILRAEVETPTTQVLRFQESGKDGYEPIYSFGKIRVKSRCKYQITFSTRPNHGVFEASVYYVHGRFLVKGRISRINKYGEQPKCIAKIIPRLREYCYCK